MLASLGVDQKALLLCLLLVLRLRLSQSTKLVVPFRFQTIGDKTIIGIDLHVAAASESSLVLRTLNVLPPQRVRFGNPCLNFLLNCEGDLKCYRLHQFQQEVADRLIDNVPGTRYTSRISKGTCCGILVSEGLCCHACCGYIQAHING